MRFYLVLLALLSVVVASSSSDDTLTDPQRLLCSAGDPSLIKRQGIRFEKYGGSKWRNGYIPYYINSNDFTNSQLNVIRDAIKSWNSRIQCLKLIPVSATSTRAEDYVYIFSGNGCWSYLGRTGGQQGMSLQSNGCVWKGTVLHQFMHAAGLAHEQNRSDRDDYVEVLWENIPERWRSQYRKTDPNDFGLQANYDYYSIMHYPMNAPETGRDAFRLKRNGVDSNQIGRGNDLTPTDIEKIRILYC